MVFRACALMLGSRKKTKKHGQRHPSSVLKHFLGTFMSSVIFKLEHCVLSALDPEFFSEFAVCGLLSGGR